MIAIKWMQNMEKSNGQRKRQDGDKLGEKGERTHGGKRGGERGRELRTEKLLKHR